MNLMISMALQEKQRIDYMLEKYQQALEDLPKGTISEKQVGGNTYYYLKYRDGGKVVSKYITKEKVDPLRQQIERRRHIESMVRSLSEERALAEKILEGNI